tara:strand:+ start:4088 stop:4312 length:225 start_codon:yes stop_codon:yes gene_type:complete
LKLCPHCGELGDGGIWCPHCNLAYDLDEARKTLSSIKTKGFTGPGSVNPNVEKFWATGDPSVFAKPGAPDYQGG